MLTTLRPSHNREARLLKLRLQQFALGTFLIQAYFAGYVFLAPWEDLNSDIESWLENSACPPQEVSLAESIVELEPESLTYEPPDASGKKRLIKTIEHTVGKGDNFFSIWNRYAGGLDRFEEAKAAFAKAGFRFSSLKAGEKVELAVRKDDGEIRRIRKKLVDGSTAVLKAGAEGIYTAYIAAPKLKQAQKVVTATIYDSFVGSARDAELPYEVIDEFVDLFAHRIDFSRDLQPGDTFSVVYDEKRVRGEDRTLGVEIQSASIKVQNKIMAVLRYKGTDGKSRYYDEKGNLLGNYFLRYPLKFTRISSVFSNSRRHPIRKIVTTHPGVDFAAPKGTPVRSVADGIVSIASFRGGGGNMIEIKHNASVRTIYMHLSRFAPGIRPGMRVSRNQVIGSVGSTGLSTGPHLDYRLSVRGKFINPLSSKLPQLIAPGEAIPAGTLKATLQALHARHENMTIARRELSMPTV